MLLSTSEETEVYFEASISKKKQTTYHGLKKSIKTKVIQAQLQPRLLPIWKELYW